MNLNPIIKVPVAELKNNFVGFGKVIPRHTTLPILATIHVERDRTGWVHLTATDLDTHVTLRLEAPGQHGDPAKFLVPYTELQKLAKTCPTDETLDLEPVSEDKLILRHRIGNHPVEQVITTLPVADFPAPPLINNDAVSLDENARTTLLNALACASDDVTRVLLNGAYLDVSKPTSHYLVGTDGRHLFASNSVHLPVASSVLIPDHRFLSWGGFIKDGQWKLSVEAATKKTGGFLKMESRRWTFVTKQIEGNYPNWRNITEEVQSFSGTLEIGDSAAEEIQRVVPRLPGGELQNRTLGLYTAVGRLWLRAWNQDDQRATEVEVPGVKVTGRPETVYVNRDYFLKAIGFGLRQIGVQKQLLPLRFSDGGSRLMIIMPVRVDAYPGNPASAPAVTAASPITPVASPDALSQPATLKPNDNQPEERNHQPMQNTTNGNGQTPPAATDTTSQPEAKSSLEQALEQIESIKASIRGTVGCLNTLADTLRQVQRERRLSEREIRSVRDTLKTLQTVRL